MFQDGDVIAFDYDLYVEGREEPYDTTQKKTAEKSGLFDPNAFYAPMHYVIGAGRLVKGLEDALRKLEVGKESKVELTPETAYGGRDPKLIETIPINEFRKNKVEPEVGLVITYKQKRGTVTFVGGGRIRVDFNHPLAGKNLRYDVIVRSVAKTPLEKVQGIIQMDFPSNVKFDVEVSKDVVTIMIPDQVRFDQNFMVAKYRMLTDLRRIEGLKTARFVEQFPLLAEKDEGAPAKTAEATTSS
jgi:FKBP-type peptidyl-prolyl cis-trans isomerase 2